MHKNALIFIEKLQKSSSAGGSALRPPCYRRMEALSPPLLRNSGYVTGQEVKIWNKILS